MRTTRLVSPFGNMDIFFREAVIGKRINAIFESIIQDERQREGDIQDMSRETGWHCISEIGSNMSTEYQRMPGVTFQQCDYEAVSSDTKQYFHFLPYSDYNWSWNQNAYVEDINTGLMALDAIIRKCLLLGLICLDVEDIFSVFSCDKTYVFIIDSASSSQSQMTQKIILSKNWDLNKLLVLLQDDKMVFTEYEKIIDEIVREYHAPDKTDVISGTYYAPGAKHRGIVFAGYA